MRLFPITVAFALFIGCDRTPDETGETDSDADTDADSDSDTDTDTDTDTDADADCGVPDAGFTGALEEGQVSSTPYANDAGIAPVIAAFPSEDDSPVTVDFPITGATITAMGHTPDGGDVWSIWVADKDGAIRTFLKDTTPITVTVAPGNKVSFRVTELTNYAGEIEITRIADFVVDDATAGPVYVQDPATETLTYAAHGREVFYAYGRITTEPVACGTAFCATWELSTGQSFDYRMGDDKPYVKNDCIQGILPLGYFDDAMQFNIDDFDWVEFY